MTSGLEVCEFCGERAVERIVLRSTEQSATGPVIPTRTVLVCAHHRRWITERAWTRPAARTRQAARQARLRRFL